MKQLEQYYIHILWYFIRNVYCNILLIKYLSNEISVADFKQKWIT